MSTTTKPGWRTLPRNVWVGILWQGIGGWPGLGPSAPFLAGAMLALTAMGLFALWRPSSQR